MLDSRCLARRHFEATPVRVSENDRVPAHRASSNYRAEEIQSRLQQVRGLYWLRIAERFRFTVVSRHRALTVGEIRLLTQRRFVL